MVDIREYETVGTIGEGAFALVRRLRSRTSGEVIAVKSLSKSNQANRDYSDRLRREIELLKRLQGIDGIIKLLGHSESLEKSDLWYAMPVADTNLFKFVRKKNNTLTPSERVVLFRRVLGAIQAAHDRAILHRDISPSNILVIDEKRCTSAVVCDFGLGLDLHSISDLTRSSADNYGHAYYVAPEQRNRLRDATVQSDVYSLGKLLNFIMTGKDPDHHHRCPYSPVIQRATEPSPSDRHPTTTHLAEHFDRVEAVRTRPAPVGELIGVVLLRNASAPQWEDVHAALTEPKYEGHSYYGYIAPVIEFFSSEHRAEDYCTAVRANVAQFIRTFVAEMDLCIRTVGWPFSRMTEIASFLGRISRVAQDSVSRGLCLVGMWGIAYSADQWDAQKTLIERLRVGDLGDDEVMVLADHILERDMAVDDDRLYDQAIPAPIRNAVRRSGGAS